MRRLIACAPVLLSSMLLSSMLMPASAWAAPMSFDLDLHVPPVIIDSKASLGCTVAWLVADIANGDVFATRMRIDSSEGDVPQNHRLPCPNSIPPRVAARALDACTSRALDPKTCVFADMSRGFALQPELRGTSENASRCRSDQASHIALACWSNGTLSICNVGCGETPEEAVAQASSRCEDKQQHSCPVAASAPLSAP